MQQQPLTPTGVNNKTAELYALSNNDLLTQANAIRTDFPAWMSVNFVLNTNQQNWLSGAAPQWLSYASFSTGFAVENRVPIIFDAPVPLPPASISKMAVVENKFQVKYSQVNGVEVYGQLFFTLTF